MSEESGFRCPACGGRSFCKDSRKNTHGVRRRRQCRDCGQRFTTMEVMVTFDGKGDMPELHVGAAVKRLRELADGITIVREDLEAIERLHRRAFEK